MTTTTSKTYTVYTNCTITSDNIKQWLFSAEASLQAKGFTAVDHRTVTGDNPVVYVLYATRREGKSGIDPVTHLPYPQEYPNIFRLFPGAGAYVNLFVEEWKTPDQSGRRPYSRTAFGGAFGIDDTLESPVTPEPNAVSADLQGVEIRQPTIAEELNTITHPDPAVDEAPSAHSVPADAPQYNELSAPDFVFTPAEVNDILQRIHNLATLMNTSYEALRTKHQEQPVQTETEVADRTAQPLADVQDLFQNWKLALLERQLAEAEPS